MSPVDMTVPRRRRHACRRLRAALRRNRLDDELREEIAQHIDLRCRQLIAEGVEPRDARALARKQFGNVTQIREESRVMWSARRNSGCDWHSEPAAAP